MNIIIIQSHELSHGYMSALSRPGEEIKVEI